jgi:hypothetical protein
MNKENQMYYEIELMLEQGTHPATISAVLDCPISFVYDVLECVDTEEYSPFVTVNS